MKRERGSQLRGARVALTALGLVLTAIGVLGLLVVADAVGSMGDWLDGDGSVVAPELEGDLSSELGIAQLIGLVVGVVLILLGLWWLRSVLPPLRHSDDVVIPNDTDVAGRNWITGHALADAVRTELEGHPDVHRARVEVRPGTDELRITLTVEDRTELRDIERRVDEVNRRVAALQGGRPLRPEVDLRLVPTARHLV